MANNIMDFENDKKMSIEFKKKIFKYTNKQKLEK